MTDAFYEPDGDSFVATDHTRGPWHVGYQHGGPPAALLARALFEPGSMLVRVSVALLRPVPIGRLRIGVERGGGRTAQRNVARLFADDRVVAEARGLCIREQPVDLPAPAPPDPWPDPTEGAAFEMDFFLHEVGYHRAVDLRVAHGSWGTSPIGMWARPRIPLVAGTDTSPTEQLMILADAQSGMGCPADPRHYTFLNPDLTVYLERPPQPRDGWFGFDIRATADRHGFGLAQSEVRDALGICARSAQALVVAARD